MKKHATHALLVLLAFFCNPLASATPAGESTMDESLWKGRQGMEFTILGGEPGVSILGANYLQSINESLRWRAGLGTLLSLGWTAGAGIDYRLPTGSRFRPVAGIDLDFTQFNVDELDFTYDDSSFLGYAVQERNVSYQLIYSTLKVGVEYQAPSGFLAGLTVQGLCGRVTLNQGKFRCGATPIPSLRIGAMF